MSSVSAESTAELGQRAVARLIALDPLLPAEIRLPIEPDPATPPACGLVFTVSGSDGAAAAIGQCRHYVHDAESPSLIWGNARQFTLRPVLGGPDVAAPLDDLLGQWRDHLAGIAQAQDEDSSAIVRWPSRDLEGIRVLQRHGLSSQSVTAARITSSRLGESVTPPPADVSIRAAGPADADLVAELSLELARYEAHFGNLRLRPWTEQVLRKEAAQLLAGPEPWAWLAERDGEPVGMLTANGPEGAASLGRLVRLTPAAYLGETFVRSDERGSGAATRLIEELNLAARAAGVAVTLLDYGQVNPLSGPFWSRQGYRPLWTTWEARPAWTLR